jgi:hypothetical protein
MSDELAPHQVVGDEYKGNPLFKIVKVDEEGKEIEKYGTIVSFGITKAKYILANIEEIQKFVEANKSESSKE